MRYLSQSSYVGAVQVQGHVRASGVVQFADEQQAVVRHVVVPPAGHPAAHVDVSTAPVDMAMMSTPMVKERPGAKPRCGPPGIWPYSTCIMIPPMPTIIPDRVGWWEFEDHLRMGMKKSGGAIEFMEMIRAQVDAEAQEEQDL